VGNYSETFMFVKSLLYKCLNLNSSKNPQPYQEELPCDVRCTSQDISLSNEKFPKPFPCCLFN